VFFERSQGELLLLLGFSLYRSDRIEGRDKGKRDTERKRNEGPHRICRTRDDEMGPIVCMYICMHVCIPSLDSQLRMVRFD
jgi:hypothetical protein